MAPFCSIVIRAYNEERHIGRLLAGISQQTVQDVDLILVDSGSTDHTLEMASQYPVRVVHIRPQEFTFGRSLNRGLAQALGEFVVLASAHVYPIYPDWLEKLLGPFEDPQVGLAYGKQRGGGTTQFSEHEIFACWYPDRSDLRQSHPFCNNANAAIRRALWLQHPYDETLPGLEDLAWARWAYEQGHGIAYVAEAEVAHIHQETPRGVYNRYRREGMAFKQIYPHEQFHLIDLARLFAGNVTNDLRVALRRKVLRRNIASIFWFRWMQFWGTYQGYRQSGPLTWRLKQAFYYPNQSVETAPARDALAQRDIQPIEYEE